MGGTYPTHSAFRNAVSSSTGYTPFQLMFGRDPIEDLDTMFPSPSRKRNLLLASEFGQKLATRIKQAYHLARNSMNLAIARQRHSYQRAPKFFKEKDMVWLFTPFIGEQGNRKMTTGWSGPWKV